MEINDTSLLKGVGLIVELIIDLNNGESFTACGISDESQCVDPCFVDEQYLRCESDNEKIRSIDIISDTIKEILENNKDDFITIISSPCCSYIIRTREIRSIKLNITMK